MKDRVPRLRDASPNRLTRALAKWGVEPDPHGGGGPRDMVFPPLGEMRRAWDARYRPRDWSLDEEWGGEGRVL